MQESERARLEEYFESIKDLSPEQMMAKVDKHLSNEDIEVFVDHLEDFYGVEDDEQLGMLAQIMVSGFIAAKEMHLS